MNPIEEIVKTLLELEYKVQNTFELYNINVLVPDDYIDKEGIRKYKSTLKRQINIATYLLEKTNELKTYMTLHVTQIVQEDKRMKAYLTRQYRKNEKQLERLLTK